MSDVKIKIHQTLYNEKPNEQKVSSHVWTAFPFPASPPHTTQPSERIWKACTLSSQVELVKETACGRIKTPKRDISVPSKRSSSPSQKFCSFSKNSWKNSGRNKKAGPKARMKLVSRCHCVTRFSGQMFNFWGQKITRQKLRKSITVTGKLNKNKHLPWRPHRYPYIVWTWFLPRFLPLLT